VHPDSASAARSSDAPHGTLPVFVKKRVSGGQQGARVRQTAQEHGRQRQVLRFGAAPGRMPFHAQGAIQRCFAAYPSKAVHSWLRPAVHNGGMEEPDDARYGVFLTPDAKTSAAVTNITSFVQAQFGLVSARRFPPHVTLAGNLPLAVGESELFAVVGSVVPSTALFKCTTAASTVLAKAWSSTSTTSWMGHRTLHSSISPPT
jgi:hypothetical protein